MNYTYRITRMDVIDNSEYQNYVVMAYYNYEGTDGTYTASVQGACKYQVTQGEFTPYDQLTESQVIRWVETSLGATGIQANQNYILNDIENQKNPAPVPHEEPLPF